MTQTNPSPPLAIRNWPTWIGLALIWPITKLPFSWQLAIGRGIGTLFYHASASRRHITATNIKLCFPELNDAEQLALTKATFRSLGMGVMETTASWWMDTKNLEGSLEVRGLENLKKAEAQNNGVIVLGCHFNNFAMAGKLLAKHADLCGIFRPQKNPVTDYIIYKSRTAIYPEMFDRKDTRGIIRALRKGRNIWLAFDQDYGREKSVFAPFFKIPAATLTSGHKLAKMTNAPSLFLTTFRKPDNSGYIAEFSEVLTGFPSGDDVADATRVNTFLETAIRRYPEQYWWLHRRFKTRPEGEESPYKKTGA